MEVAAERDASGLPEIADPASAILVDRLSDELVAFFEKWSKTGEKATTSTWCIVAQAIIAAHRMKLSPEVEKFVVAEASLRVVKKLEGEDSLAAGLAVGQIPMFYNMFKPACCKSDLGIRSSEREVSKESAKPDKSPIICPNNDRQMKSPEVGSESTEPIVVGLADVPVLSQLIGMVGTAVEKLTEPDSGKSNSSKGNIPKGRHKVKNLVDVASLVAFAFSFAAKEIRKHGGNPKLASYLNKISIITTAMAVIVPMVMLLPPVVDWIVGVIAFLMVAISVALTPDE